MKSLQAMLANELAEIPRLAQRIDTFAQQAGLPPKVAFELNLCLDELLTNTISYGYGDDESHRIAVSVEYQDGELRCEIQDDAAPFDPSRYDGAAVEATLEDYPIGGQGIHIVHSLMDDVHYRRHEGTNHLSLRMRI